MSNEHLTAISRKNPSQPMRWLDQQGLLKGRLLDYGSGRGFDADYYHMDRYDPYYHPVPPEGQYTTITCNYVLNVLEKEEDRKEVLQKIEGLLESGGTAYITIRNDLNPERPGKNGGKRKSGGKRKNGTWQGHIILDLPIEVQKYDFIIYRFEGRAL